MHETHSRLVLRLETLDIKTSFSSSNASIKKGRTSLNILLRQFISCDIIHCVVFAISLRVPFPFTLFFPLIISSAFLLIHSYGIEQIPNKIISNLLNKKDDTTHSYAISYHTHVEFTPSRTFLYCSQKPDKQNHSQWMNVFLGIVAKITNFVIISCVCESAHCVKLHSRQESCSHSKWCGICNRASCRSTFARQQFPC